MNRARPYFYRRVRLFCELSVHVVASATGVSAGRIAAIETGRREPNPTERRLIEHFLQDKLRMVLEMDGPAPEWMRPPSKALAEASRG
jgi:transcriptional regulator with XRE-family HTH domain